MAATSDSEKQRLTLQTVERALTMLEYVADRPEAPTLRVIAKDLGLNITTAYHLYNTLERRGYLDRNADGTVFLGQRATDLSQAARSHFDVGQAFAALVARLAQSTSETAYLTRWTGQAAVIHSVVEANHSLRVSGHYVGFHGDECYRASGRAVLAQLDDSAVAKVLADGNRSSTHRRPISAQHLRAILAEVRANGYAVEIEEYTDGVCCAAAPYFDELGHVQGSVAVSAPSARFQAHRQLIIEETLSAAREASAIVALERI